MADANIGGTCFTCCILLISYVFSIAEENVIIDENLMFDGIHGIQGVYLPFYDGYGAFLRLF